MAFNKLSSIRGMKDVLPEETALWQSMEKTCMQTLSLYGYREIRLPYVEKSALYQRSVGTTSDIVSKEMYTFTDQSGESISLRPEGTAGCVRALIEHDLAYESPQRLWYYGPMFRYERPQKGRYRQFTQLGVEAYGMADEAIEIELIALGFRLWIAFGIEHQVTLEINSLGEEGSRKLYREALVNYFKSVESGLDEESKKRLEINPLRILDSKNPELQDLISKAPILLDYLSPVEIERWENTKRLLEALQIPYQINPRLVRGLDYYVGLVFEWTTSQLGAQNAICAGGRYDGLVEALGGRSTPACGFAIGMERLLALMNPKTVQIPSSLYGVIADPSAKAYSLQAAEHLREALSNNWAIQMDLKGGSLKSQFKRADKSGAYFAIVIGESEKKESKITLKNLREAQEQQSFSLEEAVSYLKKQISAAVGPPPVPSDGVPQGEQRIAPLGSQVRVPRPPRNQIGKKLV